LYSRKLRDLTLKCLRITRALRLGKKKKRRRKESSRLKKKNYRSSHHFYKLRLPPAGRNKIMMNTCNKQNR